MYGAAGRAYFCRKTRVYDSIINQNNLSTLFCPFVFSFLILLCTRFEAARAPTAVLRAFKKIKLPQRGACGVPFGCLAAELEWEGKTRKKTMNVLGLCKRTEIRFSRLRVPFFHKFKLVCCFFFFFFEFLFLVFVVSPVLSLSLSFSFYRWMTLQKTRSTRSVRESIHLARYYKYHIYRESKILKTCQVISRVHLIRVKE